MATAVKRRRGTRTENLSLTGQSGEWTHDETLKIIRVHDGIQAGGYPLSRADWHGGNVKLYGAVGDGVTDDSAAIVAAMDATNHVFLPPGNFKINSTVYLHGRGKRIRGSGMGATTITVAAGIVGFVLGNETGDADVNHDMVLENLKITGGTYPLQVGSAVSPTAFLGRVSNVWLTGGTSGGLFLHSAQHALFECLEVTGNAKGIVSLTTGGTNTNCTFQKCRVYLNTGVGVYFEQALNFRFIGCNIESNDKEGVKMTKSDGYSIANIAFSSCWFESNLADGTTGSATVLAEQAGGATTYVSELLFADCEFNGVTTSASNIHLKLAADNVVIMPNRFLTPTAAINITKTNAAGFSVGNSSSNFVASQRLVLLHDSITLPNGSITLTSGSLTLTAGNATLSNGRVRATSQDQGYHLFRVDGLGDNGEIAIFQQSTSGNTLEVHWFLCGSDADRAGLYWGLQGIGNTRMWIDDTGDLRVSTSNPSADDSGTVVGTQTFSGTHIYKIGDPDLAIGEAVKLVNRKLYRTTSEKDPLCCGVFAGKSELLVTSFDEVVPHTVDEETNEVTLLDADKAGAVIALGDTRFKQSGETIVGVLVDGPVTKGAFGHSSATPGRFTQQSDDVAHSYTTLKFMEDGDGSGPVYAYILS